jgi:predicted ATPase/class 3 adenylate cyclase
MKSLVKKTLSETKEYQKNISDILKLDLKSELGGVLTSVLPEVEILIGKKSIPEPASTMKETQDRLFDTFVKFFNCFTSDNTLVLVLDDLQWADAASFQFLENILSLKNGKIFIIGAYRDNEVDETHPLKNIIHEFKSIYHINLQPLKLDDLNEMVAETLDTSKEETMKLSELIHKKTLGNPFFSREFINTLYQEELIYLKDDSWKWDVSNVEKMNFSSNVIDFMVKNLKKKPESMQKLLNRAACIGNTFKIEQLKWVWEDSSFEQELLELITEGWLSQINTDEYQFFHDRLQQAAYELFEKDAEKIHLIIGNILLEEFKKQDSVEQNIFAIINHLNIAKSSFQDQKELLKLNLIAAKKSLENSAFSSCLKFSNLAFDLLPKDVWESDYQLALETHSVHADTLYANSNLVESESVYNILLEKVVGRVDKLRVYSNFMKMASLSHQYDKAYALFVTTFKMFDLTKDIPFEDVMGTLNWTLNLKKKIDQEVTNIGGMKNILTLKDCKDQELIIFLTIMFESLDIIFIAPTASPVMLITNSLVALYMFLTQGMSPSAALGLGFAGWIYSFFFKEKDGYQLTLATEKLLSQTKNPKYNVVAAQFLIGVGNITGGNFKQQIFHLDNAIKHAMTHGEYLFGAYSINHSSMSLIFNGENFQTLLPKLKKRQLWLKQVKNYFISDFAEAKIQFISELAGISKWNPQFTIPNIRTLKCADTFIPTTEGILYYHKGDYENALKMFDISEPFADNEQGLFDYYEFKMYHCLTLTYFYKKIKQESHLVKIKKYLEDYKALAELGPEYLTPRYKLMEIYFKTLHVDDKMGLLNEFEELYESAIKFGLIIISGVIAEIIVEFCEENNFPKSFCSMYFYNSLKIWSGLSAKTKTDQLKKKYSKYLSATGTHRSSSASSISTTHHTTNDSESVHYATDSLDMMSIIKASQALTVELTTSSLIMKVLGILIENTGADSGVLIFSEKNEDFIEATMKKGKVTSIQKPTKAFKENELYCSLLLTLSKTMKKSIIINDVPNSEFSDNEYLQREGIKSICIHPIIKGNKHIGSIYLENKSLEGIFDENRISILEHISSQLAISYENTKLYDDMNSLNSSYERFLPKEFLTQLGKGDVRNIKKGDASSKNLCVLFSDIRNFTDLTEKMNPEESFSFVNQILEYIAPIISKHNGFIDKFFGDCIMALFPNEVDDSIKCGYDMLEALKSYNKECRQGKSQVEIGIGVHFGNVMIGTIGAENRIDATVISDTVNTASRVESLTKTLGAKFVVTENVLQNSKSLYKNRYIGKYLLKGKENAVSLFHMLEKHSEKDVEKFTDGIQQFESRKFEKAKEIFSSLNDKTSKYLENVAMNYGNYLFDNSWNGEIKIDKDGNLVELTNILVNEKKIDELKVEDEHKIMKMLMESGDVKEMLKSWSKEFPEKVRSIIGNYSK